MDVPDDVLIVTPNKSKFSKSLYVEILILHKFGIDIIAREEERKILKIRIQGYNNGNQIIDTMFTFHSIYNDELPPTGSILDINTYQINLIN